MESIINKLTEIESAASAIAEHAELQKSVLDKEYEEKRKQFVGNFERTCSKFRIRGFIMVKTLLNEVKEYKKDTILSPVYVSIEAILEVFIPFLMAILVDNGIEKGI